MRVACFGCRGLELPASTAAVSPCSVVRFVDVQRAVAEQGAVQSGNGLSTIGHTRHLHEAKLAGLARIAVPDNGYSIDRTVSCEELAQFVFAGIEAKVSNENILHLAALSPGQQAQGTVPARLAVRSQKGIV